MAETMQPDQIRARMQSGALTTDQLTDELIDRGVEHARAGFYEAVAGQLVMVIAVFAALAAVVATVSGVVATGNCDAIAPCDAGGGTIALAAGAMLLSIGALAIFVHSGIAVWRAGRATDAEAGKRALRRAGIGLGALAAAAAWAGLLVLAGADPLPWV